MDIDVMTDSVTPDAIPNEAKKKVPEENIDNSTNSSSPAKPQLTLNTNEFIRKVADNLESDDDFYKLKFLCRPWLSVNKFNEIQSSHHLFNALKTKCDETHLIQIVTQLLYTIQRFDLLKLGNWCKHNVNIVMGSVDHINQMQKKAYEMIESLSRNDEEGIVNKLLPWLEDKDKKERQYILEGFEEWLGQDLMLTVEKRLRSIEDHPYPMDASPCGICLIINNENFCDSDKMPTRKGTDIDSDALKQLFEDFDFITVVKKNLTCLEIKEEMKKLSESDHSKYNCVAVCILTHGEEGVVIGTDCNPVYIQKDIVQQFHSDHKTKSSLIGKPKLFFIQACQGVFSMNAVQSDGPRILLPEFKELSSIESDSGQSHPAKSDDLICMSTAKGFLAYRSPSMGSWFITTLVRNLRLFGTEKDIMDVMRIVNKDVGEEESCVDGKKVKQMPIEKTTLRRQFRFRLKKGVKKSIARTDI